MSTCPEKDVHSVYVDGELPEKFLAEYESHIASCPKCQGELKVLRELKSIFKEDSDAISESFTQAEMNASFTRLQAKLSYSKNVINFNPEEKNKTYGNRRKLNGLQYFAAGIAAAAVFAFLAPNRLHRQQNPAVAEFEPVARKELVSSVKQISSRGQIVSNNFSGFAGPENYNQKVYYVPSASSFSNVMPEGVIPLNVAETNQFPPPPQLSSYDVFAFDNHEAAPNTDRSRDFSFHITSPFADISVEFGK